MANILATRKRKNGRWYVKLSDGREMPLSRWKMEQKLGRRLLRSERVHHIDENPSNDDIDNLQVVTVSEHNKIHRTGYK